jgi:hypothetical protein
MLKLLSVGLLSILLVPVFNLPASAQNNIFYPIWNENWRLINEQQQQERYGNTNNNSAPRFRSPNASSSSTSQLTPEQIREVAKMLKTTSSRLAWTTQETCKLNIKINGRPLSSSEMSILKNELGC